MPKKTLLTQSALDKVEAEMDALIIKRKEIAEEIKKKPVNSVTFQRTLSTMLQEKHSHTTKQKSSHS